MLILDHFLMLSKCTISNHIDTLLTSSQAKIGQGEARHHRQHDRARAVDKVDQRRLVVHQRRPVQQREVRKATHRQRQSALAPGLKLTQRLDRYVTL